MREFCFPNRVERRRLNTSTFWSLSDEIEENLKDDEAARGNVHQRALRAWLEGLCQGGGDGYSSIGEAPCRGCKGTCCWHRVGGQGRQGVARDVQSFAAVRGEGQAGAQETGSDGNTAVPERGRERSRRTQPQHRGRGGREPPRGVVVGALADRGRHAQTLRAQEVEATLGGRGGGGGAAAKETVRTQGCRGERHRRERERLEQARQEKTLAYERRSGGKRCEGRRRKWRGGGQTGWFRWHEGKRTRGAGTGSCGWSR
ncbi:unnamed protein product, partial [Scytosiphon promiscuus]